MPEGPTECRFHLRRAVLSLPAESRADPKNRRPRQKVRSYGRWNGDQSRLPHGYASPDSDGALPESRLYPGEADDGFLKAENPLSGQGGNRADPEGIPAKDRQQDHHRACRSARVDQYDRRWFGLETR